MKRNLLEPHVIKRSGTTIEINDALAKLLVGDHVLMTFVVNDKKIVIKGLDIHPGNKIIDMMIRVNKTFTDQAFGSITRFFISRVEFTIQQTTGFCLPPDKPDRESITGEETAKRNDTCLWESLVDVPEDTDLEKLKREIMEINVEYEEKVISSATIMEVPVE